MSGGADTLAAIGRGRYRRSVSLATLVTLSLVVVAPSSGGGPEEGPAAAAVGGAAVGPDGPVPPHVLWRDYVRIEKPRSRGHGLLIAAGATFGVGALIQLGDLAFADNGGLGVMERVFIGPAMILAPLGGLMRGRYDAYMDASIGRRPRKAIVPIAVGLTVAAIGAVGGLTNEAFWWQCNIGESGPYFSAGPISEAGFDCRTTLSRIALDSSALLVSGGLGLSAWGFKYRRDTRAYSRAVFAVVPRVRVGELGVGLMGRF